MEIIPKNMERLRERDAPGNSWTGWLKIQVVDHDGGGSQNIAGLPSVCRRP